MHARGLLTAVIGTPCITLSGRTEEGVVNSHCINERRRYTTRFTRRYATNGRPTDRWTYRWLIGYRSPMSTR